MKTAVEHKAKNAWGKVRVGDALQLINGRAFKPSEWKEKGLPIVRIQNLNNPEASYNYYEGELPKKFLLNNGDLLFAWSGTPGTSFGAHIWRGHKAWLNQHIFKVIFDEAEFDKRFLRLAINQNLNDYIQAAHGAAGLAHITKGKFEQSELVKPTLDEQRNIVAEIEKQFSRLDEAVTSLERTKANLKRYKAAVLKAAVEGKLTEDWRKQQPNVDPAIKLLKRILVERRAKWNGRGKYKEPLSPKPSDVPSLPKGWAWATVEQLSMKVVDGTHHTPAYTASGVPFLSVKDIRNGQLFFDDCKFVSQDAHDALIARCHPQPEDILITKSGTIGRIAIVKTARPFSLFVSVALIKTIKALFMQEFFKLALEYYISTINIDQDIKGGLLKNLHLEDLRVIRLRIAPLAEQKVIVAEVERRLSVIDELDTTVEANLTRADRLRQSILQQAFKGELF